MIFNWYDYLFFGALIFVVLKALISFVAGDMDIDFDADGDIDFDVSSMLSFKGILHFILGFATYLECTARLVTSNVDIANNYHFAWYSYLIAIVIGCLFTLLLGWLYNCMIKLNHGNVDEPNLDGCDCTILTKNGMGDEPDSWEYSVLVKTFQGLFKKTVLSYNPYLKIGSEHKIERNEFGHFVI